MTMTGGENSDVIIYDGTCLFASTNTDTPGLTDPDDSVNINDLRQGAIGDCGLLAALGAMVKKDPALIHNLIQNNGNGTARVDFFPTVGGPAVQITVSLTLDAGYTQADLSGDYCMSAGATPHREWEIWPQVLEKAYALFRAQQGENVNNVYANLDGVITDQAWQQLTTQTAQNVPTAGLTAGFIALNIKFRYAADAMIVVSSNLVIPNPVVSVDNGDVLNYEIARNHAYVLLRIWQDPGGNDIMELFNPHGGDPGSDAATTNADGPITGPVIEVPLWAFNTYFRAYQWQ